jgi:hypothetical protein
MMSVGSKEEIGMRKWVSVVMALSMMAVFSLGCSNVSKQSKVKCPKCGAVFTVQEGIDAVGRDKAQ